jgi:hypothetical protein
MADHEHESDVLAKARLRYKRLDYTIQEIRILKLVEGGDSSIIRCTLEHTSLVDPGEYTALSYCWGDSTITKDIVVNDCTVPVTTNLYSALKKLRSRGYTRLWVDALCIDQENLEERSLQVRSMRQIYNIARRVVSWIGEEDESLLEVARLLKERTTSGIPRPEEDNRSIMDIANSHSRRNKIMNAWSKIDKFWDRPYWKRVWILQEVAVASELLVLCGNIEIAWNDIANALEDLEMAQEDLKREKPNELAFLYAIPMARFRRDLQLSLKPITLLDALRWSHRAHATDERDKVFALLGLCFDGLTLVPVPNYARSTDSIFNELTRRMIAVSRSLDIICYGGTKEQQEFKAPTWMPDWRKIWSSPMSIQQSTFSNWHTKFESNPLLGGTNSICLRVQVLVLDSVDDIGSTIYDSEASSNIPKFIRHRSWVEQQLQPSEAGSEGTELAILDAIILSLCGGSLPAFYNPNQDEHAHRKNILVSRSCFTSLWAQKIYNIPSVPLKRWLVHHAKFFFCGRTLRQWSQIPIPHETNLFTILDTLKSLLGMPTEDPSAANLNKFLDHVEAYLSHSTRLFVTVSDFFGMTDAHITQEDKLCYIQGCSIPLFLRNREIDGKMRTTLVGGASVCLDSKLKSLVDDFVGGHLSSGHISLTNLGIVRGRGEIQELDIY